MTYLTSDPYVFSSKLRSKRRRRLLIVTGLLWLFTVLALWLAAPSFASDSDDSCEASRAARANDSDSCDGDDDDDADESEDEEDKDHVRTGAGQPVNGWWWDPNRNGQGFSIEIHRNRLFLGAFTYDTDRRAVWWISTGGMTDAQNYSGQLIQFSGGRSMTRRTSGSAHLSGTLGRIDLAFASSTTGTLTLPSCETLNIERFDIVANGAAESWDRRDPRRPTTGWYWNPRQSGTGFFVETQGDRLFLVTFLYRDDGTPVWYVANQGLAAAEGSSRTYTGTLFEYQAASSTDGIGTDDGTGGTGTGVGSARSPSALSDASSNRGRRGNSSGESACSASTRRTSTAGVTTTDGEDETGDGDDDVPVDPPSLFQEVGQATLQFQRKNRATLMLPTGETISAKRFRF
jgi:hypothetical protein